MPLAVIASAAACGISPTLASARASKISYGSGDRKKEGIFANLSIFENLLLPVYRARHQGKEFYFYSQEALDQWIETEEKAAGQDLEVHSDDVEAPPGGVAPAILLNEFHAAVEVGAAVRGTVVPLVERPLGVQHLDRLLRRRAGIQVDQRVAVAHRPGQHREVGPDRPDVEVIGELAHAGTPRNFS